MGYPTLCTRRINQDALENLFSVFRQRGGFNRNPTVRTFRYTFKHVTINTLIKPPETTNYNKDDDILLMEFGRRSDHIPQTPETEENILEEEDSISSSSSEEMDELIECNVTLEDCAITYFAGYICAKVISKFTCDECKKKLTLDEPVKDKNYCFILNKTFNLIIPETFTLLSPSGIAVDIVKILW